MDVSRGKKKEELSNTVWRKILARNENIHTSCSSVSVFRETSKHRIMPVWENSIPENAHFTVYNGQQLETWHLVKTTNISVAITCMNELIKILMLKWEKR